MLISRVVGRVLIAVAPLGLLVAAFLVTRDPSHVPRPIAMLAPGIAYLATGGAALLGLAFHRGRTFYSALVLLIAFGALDRVVADARGFESRTVYAALCMLPPLLLMTLAVLGERGGVRGGLPRLAMIAVACAIPAAMIYAGEQRPLHWAYLQLVELPAKLKTPIPQLGVVAIAASLAGTVVLAGKRGRTLPALWLIVALGGALHGVNTAVGPPAYFTAAGLILGISVLSESYRMAFQDELTGVPSRRSLEEALRSLGGGYAIGVVDIDHFKRLNDTYGHDVGDHVLRMVGAKLMDVAGGGRAFRYGGEEFVVLFAGKDVDEALPFLEQLRATIAGHRVAIRSAPRERRGDARARRQAGGDPEPASVSVTVSIGVASRSEAHPDPRSVIKAADVALYRAKHGGRNRVCT